MWVATEDRRFMRFPLPSQGVKPGQEVWVTPSQTVNSSFTRRWALVASLLVLLLFGATLAQILPYRSTVAYVALDINPSLELAVNSFGRVTKIMPLNQDAQLLLEGLSVKGKDIYETLDVIIQKSEKAGYISPEKENLVLLTLVTVRAKDNQLDASQVKAVVLSRMANTGMKGKVGIQTASLEEKEKARQEGLSVNSYLIIKKASSKGLPLVLPGERQTEVRDIVQKLATEGVSLEQLLEDTAVSLPRADNGKITNAVPKGTKNGSLRETGFEVKPVAEPRSKPDNKTPNNQLPYPSNDVDEPEKKFRDNKSSTPSQTNNTELNSDNKAENRNDPKVEDDNESKTAQEIEDKEAENETVTPPILEEHEDHDEDDYIANDNAEDDKNKEDTEDHSQSTNKQETHKDTRRNTTASGNNTDTDEEKEEDKGTKDNHKPEPAEKDDKYDEEDPGEDSGDDTDDKD